MKKIESIEKIIILYAIPFKGIEKQETFIIYQKKGNSFFYSTEKRKKESDIPLSYIEAVKLIKECLLASQRYEEAYADNPNKVMTLLDAGGPEIIYIHDGKQDSLLPKETFSRLLGHLRQRYIDLAKEGPRERVN